MARLQAEDVSSVDSRASSGFGGTEFWDALRQVGSAFSAHLVSFALNQPMFVTCIASTGFQSMCCAGQRAGIGGAVSVDRSPHCPTPPQCYSAYGKLSRQGSALLSWPVHRERETVPEACVAQVEHDLAWVRLLIGLHATRARGEVNEIVSGIVEMGTGLQFTEDKLTNIMEAAQVSLATPTLPHCHMYHSLACLITSVAVHRSWVWWALCANAFSCCGRL